MIDFLQMIASGIAVGSSYALMGIAMVIIYRASEVPNFAQGEMALISSYFTFMLLDQYGFPYHVAFPAAFLFSALLGFFLEFTILRRAKEPNILGMIIITLPTLRLCCLINTGFLIMWPFRQRYFFLFF